MTISAFCRDQLLAHGPLPLEKLAERAAAAGVTTARDPVSAVRSAITYKEVLLADGRWATPLWLLEGRILTARRLPYVESWSEDVDDEDDGLTYDPHLEDPDLNELPDTSCHDLALLSQALERPSPTRRRRAPAPRLLRRGLEDADGLARAPLLTSPAAGSALPRRTAPRRAGAGDGRAAYGRPPPGLGDRDPFHPRQLLAGSGLPRVGGARERPVEPDGDRRRAQQLDHDQRTATIPAPPELLYGIVSDVTRTPEYSPEIASCHWLNGAVGPSAGARFEAVNTANGKSWKNRPVVTEVEPGRVFAFARTEPFSGTVAWRWTFEPTGDGPA